MPNDEAFCGIEVEDCPASDIPTDGDWGEAQDDESNPRQRFLNMSNIYADLAVIRSKRSGKNVSIVMMNGNFGDEAVLRNIYVKPTMARFTECASSYGVNQSGAKPMPVCQYTYDDVHIIQSKQKQGQQEQQEQLEQQQPSGKLCVF
ncbi:Pectin lyase fold [Phytophthora cactorum]|nr:Pectin lyase fold [Phytophthora cactorum]